MMEIRCRFCSLTRFPDELCLLVEDLFICGKEMSGIRGKGGEDTLSTRQMVLTGTIIGNPVPFKDVETEESSFVVRMMLDQPFQMEERTVLDVFVHIDPVAFQGQVGQRIRVQGEVYQKQVITRSGKSGKHGIFHVKPVTLDRLDT
jgi:hypothetical protein